MRESALRASEKEVSLLFKKGSSDPACLVLWWSDVLCALRPEAASASAPEDETNQSGPRWEEKEPGRVPRSTPLQSQLGFFHYKWQVKVTQSCPTLCDPRGYSQWKSPGQNTGLGSLSLLQGIFPTQKQNWDLPHCRLILYQLSHKGSPVFSVTRPNKSPFWFKADCAGMSASGSQRHSLECLLEFQNHRWG